MVEKFDEWRAICQSFPFQSFPVNAFPMKAKINSSKLYSSKFLTCLIRQTFALYGIKFMFCEQADK